VHLARPDVAVDVGGDAYAGVPQDPADDLQLRPLLQHLGGVEVPQPVGGERLDAGPDAGPLQGLLDVVYLGVAGPGLPREEEGRAGGALLHVLPEGHGDFGQQGDDPQPVTLAGDPELERVQVYVLLPQAGGLGEPQPGVAMSLIIVLILSASLERRQPTSSTLSTSSTLGQRRSL